MISLLGTPPPLHEDVGWRWLCFGDLIAMLLMKIRQAWYFKIFIFGPYHPHTRAFGRRREKVMMIIFDVVSLLILAIRAYDMPRALSDSASLLPSAALHFDDYLYGARKLPPRREPDASLIIYFRFLRRSPLAFQALGGGGGDTRGHFRYRADYRAVIRWLFRLIGA